MVSAAALLSVSTPPLVKELAPSKLIVPVLDRVRVPLLVRAGELPLLPMVMPPASVTLPVDAMVRPVPSTVMLASEVPDTARARDPSTVVGPLTVRLRPFVPVGVPMVSAAPWAMSRLSRLGDTLESTTVSLLGMHTSAPVAGTEAGLQLVPVFQSVVLAPPVQVAVQVGAAAAGGAPEADDRGAEGGDGPRHDDQRGQRGPDRPCHASKGQVVRDPQTCFAKYHLVLPAPPHRAGRASRRLCSPSWDPEIILLAPAARWKCQTRPAAHHSCFPQPFRSRDPRHGW